MNDLYLIFKNLVRRKLRLFLTLFAIFIAFTIFGVLSAFQAALNAGVDLAAADRLVIVNKVNFTQPLPISYVNRVKLVEGVESVAYMNWFGGYYQDPRNNFPMFAASEEELLDLYPELLLTDGERQNFLSNRIGLIAGSSIAAQYGWKVGDRIPISSNIFSNIAGGQTWEFEVSGIYRAGGPNIDTISVYFHFDYFNESRTFGKDYIGFMAIRTAGPELNEQVISAIDSQFENSFFETETVPEKVFAKAFISQIGNIGLIITSVVGAAFFTILIIAGNTMVLAIQERTAEIGVMKTLGFTSARLFKLVLGESLSVAVLGGAAGLLLAAAIVSALNNANVLPFVLLMADWVILRGVLFILLLGLLTGIFPAFTAMRLNIITALTRRG